MGKNIKYFELEFIQSRIVRVAVDVDEVREFFRRGTDEITEDELEETAEDFASDALCGLNTNRSVLIGVEENCESIREVDGLKP